MGCFTILAKTCVAVVVSEAESGKGKLAELKIWCFTTLFALLVGLGLGVLRAAENFDRWFDAQRCHRGAMEKQMRESMEDMEKKNGRNKGRGPSIVMV